MIVLMGSLFSCSSTPKKRSVGEVIDDSVVTNKLKVKYLRDKVVKGFRVDIDTWKGVVSLRGKFESQEQIDRAIEIAERQTGVKEVKSYLIIKTAESKQKSDKVKGYVEEKDLEVAPFKEEEVAKEISKEPEGKTFEDESDLDRPPAQVTGDGY